MKFSKLLFYLIPLLILAIIVLCAFNRTLGNYFLEDDFGEIQYVSKIFAGNWQLLASNFTGNYMQIPTIKVYRPCLLLSIMTDFALWRTTACGYFITNITFLIGAAMMLYMVLRQLTRSWSIIRSIAFSLLSAALFASSPLHCESVSLMVGRVDIICSFFYLLALWAFIRKGSSGNVLLSVIGLISFWVALLTKEMAIGLPLILTMICFLFPGNMKPRSTDTFSEGKVNESLPQRLQLSLLVTYPVWLSLFVYLVIRFFALGTLTGGYVGSIGAYQQGQMWTKWADPDTLVRIIFPFNHAVFGDHSLYYWLLSFIYFSLAVLIIVRFVVLGIPRAWLALLAVWALSALLPIYQLWGLGIYLEGARFLFFLTIPLAILIPALIFAPVGKETKPMDMFAAGMQGKRQIPISLAAAVSLLILIILQTSVAAKNNAPWIHAGKQTKALRDQGQKLAQSLSQNQKIIVLGIPKNIDGAHVIYNGSTFNILMEQPFSSADLADHFITFDPLFFGNADLINRQRFGEELSRPDVTGCYIWNQEKLNFEQLNELKPVQSSESEASSPPIFVKLGQGNIVFPFTEHRGLWEMKQDTINIEQCDQGAGLVINPVSIDPLTCDFLEMEADIDPQPTNEKVEAFWSGTKSNGQEFFAHGAFHPNPSSHLYRIAVSRYWRWFTEGSIKNIGVEIPAAKSINIHNIRLVAATQIMPKLSVVDQKADNVGIYPITGQGVKIQAEGESIPDCVDIKVELSKPNYFFDNFTLDSSSAILSSVNLGGPNNTTIISNQAFPASAYYQLRAIALNKDGLNIGEWSDPVTVRFAKGKQ